MRQLTCTAPHQIEWRDVPEPRLEGDTEALVRPLAVARCDIDLFLTSGFVPLRGPFALGHEAVAEVVDIGDAVTGVTRGQRVVVSFEVSCGDCRPCHAGHTANCDRYPVLSDIVRVPHAAAMLAPLAPGLDPVALASVSDNVLDGYRAVAPHLRSLPGADVLIVCHGGKSIPLYAVQAALALGAGVVDYASDSAESLALAERLGARPLETNFEKPKRRYPVVVDAGMTPAGLQYAIRATEPEGILQSVSFYPGDVPMPLGRLYTLGVRFFIGRTHAAALLPEVMPLIEQRRLRPEAVTTRIVEWDAAAAAYGEPAIKLVVRRS